MGGDVGAKLPVWESITDAPVPIFSALTILLKKGEGRGKRDERKKKKKEWVPNRTGVVSKGVEFLLVGSVCIVST